MAAVSVIPAQVGQLLWVGFDGQTPPDSLLRRIRAGEAGAAVVFARNLAPSEAVLQQATALCRRLHEAAPADAPFLVAVDQEGGRVQRLKEPLTVWPPMLRLGAAAARGEEERAEQLACAIGRALGDELAALGFDIDFAPVLDVLTNPDNPVIGDRAFGTTPEQVTILGGAFARGLAEAGLLACGKHFPGHGDTSVDSHLALPRVDHPLERLHAIELAPFRMLVQLPMIMTAHVVFAAIDDQVPATLSPRVLSDLLRRQLGFDGVVVSDDLEMKAITDHYGLEDAVERALLAGCDAFLLCHLEELQQRAFEHLVRAAERSSEVRTRLGEASSRVAAMKRGRIARPRPGLHVIGNPAHRDLTRELRD